jgi:preprotein translocase subunit YajC
LYAFGAVSVTGPQAVESERKYTSLLLLVVVVIVVVVVVVVVRAKRKHLKSRKNLRGKNA